MTMCDIQITRAGNRNQLSIRGCEQNRTPNPGCIGRAGLNGGGFLHLPLRSGRDPARGCADRHDHHRWLSDPPILPRERPHLRDNFMGRMRAAMGWFSQLPLLTRHSILVKGLVGAAVAFMIGIGAVYAAETIIGNSLSCGLWSDCPKGATPGTHLGGGDGTGASPTINLGRAKTNITTPLQNAPQNRGQNTLKPQNSDVQRHPAASPEKQQDLPQVAPDSRSDHNPSIQKAQEPLQPQTPQKTPVITGEEPAVKPGSGEQVLQSEQNPSAGGASAPSRQGTLSGGTNSPPPNSSSEKATDSSSSALPEDATK